MRNKRLPETVLLDEVIRRLASELPAGWRMEGLRRESRSGAERVAERDYRSDGIVDAFVDIVAGKLRTTLAIEVREQFEARDATRVLMAFDNEPQMNWLERPSRWQRMLITRFLSPRARDLLVAKGWSYADATGNVRIAVESPALFIKLNGSERDPAPEARPLRSLRGPVAARIIRELIDRKPPYGVRELAFRSLTSAAMASRVVALLEREAIVDKDGRGPILGVNWRALLARWAEEYQFQRFNRVERYIALRGFAPMFEQLRVTGRRYAITGPLFAERRRTLASSRLAMIYTDDVPALARELELGPSGAVANVLLAEPGDAVVYQRMKQEDGLWFVAPSQAAADLMTSGDRNPRLAEALMEWMAENEDAWRS